MEQKTKIKEFVRACTRACWLGPEGDEEGKRVTDEEKRGREATICSLGSAARGENRRAPLRGGALARVFSALVLARAVLLFLERAPAAAAVAAGITAPAAPPGLKRRAPFARGSAHTKPTKDEQRDVDKGDRVQKSIEFREAQALLSEYLGDERVDGVGVTPQVQAVTKPPPPSKVRQAFERKLPPGFVKKPESPIKYPGENLWSRASETQPSHRDSSESALERYLLEFGYDLPEDP